MPTSTIRFAGGVERDRQDLKAEVEYWKARFEAAKAELDKLREEKKEGQ